MPPIRLIIADDHRIVREGLKSIVSQSDDIRVIAEAEDGDTAEQVCTTLRPDVLLLDVSMPGPGVLELIVRLKAGQPRLAILVLSVHAERHYARRVLKAGADGYLTKNYSSVDLASAIRQVYGGRKYVSPTLAQELAFNISGGLAGQTHDALSNREFEVFLSLGAGESIDHIAQRLRLSAKTVRTYRSRILEKMNLESTAQIIFYAVQSGLVTEVAEPGACGGSDIDTDTDRKRSRRNGSTHGTGVTGRGVGKR